MRALASMARMMHDFELGLPLCLQSDLIPYVEE